MSKNEYKEGVYDYWKERIEKNPIPIKLAQLEEIIEGWENNVRDMEANHSAYSGSHIEKVNRRLVIKKKKQLVSNLKGLLEKYQKSVDDWDNETSNSKPDAYRGELTDECIRDLEELAEIYPDMAINEFFETAYNQKESCRKVVKVVNGERKKVDIKWSTLRNRVKNLEREDIYYRNRSKRKK